MIILLFLFIAASQALHLKKSLGDIYLSQNEVYELALSDFFDGNNLTYQILSTNSENNEISLENKMNFELLSFRPYPLQSNKNLSTSSGQKTYTILNYPPYQIVCDFYENNIYLYKLTEKSNNLLLIWYGQIKTEYAFSHIKSIEGVREYRQNCYFLLIQFQQQENIDDNLVWRNDFYIMNLTDISAIQEPIIVNFSRLTYANNIIMSFSEFKQIVYIYGEFPDNKNAIFLYNFINPYSPIYIQDITQYFITPKEIQTLSVKSILTSSSYLFVLDSNIGFIVYSCMSRIPCMEQSFIDLRSAGDLKSMRFLYGSMLGREVVNVLSNKGNILISPVTGILRQWIPSYTNNGHIYNPSFIQCFDSFYFIQYETSVKSILAIYKNNNFENTLYEIEIEKIIGKHYNPNGFWTIIQKFPINSITYLRSDFDGIRQFEIKISPYSLKVKGKSDFNAEIFAYENNNESLNSVSSIINVITIPENSSEIYLLNENRPIKISPRNVFIDSNDQYLFLSPPKYFSGPNLNFTVTTRDSEFFTFKSSQIEKLKFISNKTLPKNIEWVENSFSLIYYFKDHIIIDNISFNVTNPIKVLMTGTDALIYWKTAESNPMITFHTFSGPIITQSWETASECTIFKLTKMNNQFVCSNGEIIDIYYQGQEGFWKRQNLISGNDFEGNFTWNLADIENCGGVPHELLNNYLYLADKVKGLLVIDIQRLYSLPFRYITTESSLTGTLKIFSIYKYTIILRENFSVNIFAIPLSYIRTIQLENSGTLTRAESLGDLILLQFEETLFVIKANEPAHNALYFKKKIGFQGYFSLNNYWLENDGRNEKFLYFFYLNSTEKHYETYLLYFLDYREDSSRTMPSNEISIKVKNPEALVEQSYPAEITIAANNNHKYLSISLPLNLIVSGSFVWFEPYNWNIKETISYDEEYEFNLNSVFFGQNLDFALNVNGKNLNSSGFSTFPARITPKIEIIDFYSSSTTLYHQTLIPNTDIRIITSTEGFIILNSSGFQKTLYYSSYSFKSLKCQLIDTVNFTKNNTALLATSCHYRINEFSNTENIPSKIYLLALWEFDYISFSVNRFNSIKISYNPSYLRIIALNDTNFEIMTAQQYPEFQITQILHFRGKWTANGIDIEQLGSIDAFSLNIPSFNSWFFDGYPENSENSVWFILDQSYGIRILKVSSNNLEIIDGISHDEDYYFSVGVCGDYLYALKTSNILQKILIKDLNNLKIIETFFSGQKYGQEITRLSCSEDGKYIGVFHLFFDNTKLLRVYDTYAKNSSILVADIKLCNCYQSLYANEYVFVDLNTISVIECAPGGKVTTFKINQNILKIPKLSTSEYEKIIDEWETNNFDIFITAKNENNEVNSTIVKFVRVITEKNQENQDKIIWWVWVIVAAAVVITGTMSFNLMKNLMLKKKDRNLANQALVLSTIKENQA